MNHKTTKRFSARFAAAVTVFSLIASAFPAPFSLPVAEAATSFDSSSFESGFSGWDARDTWTVETGGAQEGSSYAKSHGTSSSQTQLTREIDTTGYENITLTFWYKTDDTFESGDNDKVTVYESLDGSSHSGILTLDDSDNTSTWTKKSVSLSTGADDNPNTEIRFTISANAVTGDEFHLDNIKIEGDLIPSVAERVDGSGDSDDADFSSIQEAIDDSDTDPGDTILLKENVTTSEQITIDKGIILDGDGYTIDADFKREDFSNNSAIGVQSDDVTIQNLELTSSGDDTWPDQLHGINVYESTDVTIDNVSTDGFEGSGILVNGSTVNASDITTSGSGWHGINVDQGSDVTQPAVLNISNTSSHDENSPSAPGDFVDGQSVPHIFIDENDANATVNDIDGQYVSFNVPFRQDPQGSNFIDEDNEATVYTLKSGDETPEAEYGSEEKPYDGEVDICHAKGKDAKNGYTSQSPNVHSLFQKGHDEHLGGADIIPPFWYDTEEGAAFYEGKNWDEDGRAIYDNDCVDPDDEDDDPKQCIPGKQWADEVIEEETNQGDKKNGNDVDANRSDADESLDAADGTFYSLGEQGVLTVKFDEYIVATSGPDVSVHEVTGGRSSYPEETASVEVSQDGSNWFTVGVATNKATNGENLFDIEGTGLDYVQYVRLTDTTDLNLHGSTADGFDVDAIDGVYGVCEAPEPEPDQCEIGFEVNFDEDTTVDGYETFGATAGAFTIREISGGYEVALRENDDNNDWIGADGVITFTNADLSGATITPGTGNEKFENGSGATTLDTATIAGDTVEFDLQVTSADDVFTITGIEKDCDDEPETYQCSAGPLFLDVETDYPDSGSLHTVDTATGAASLFADYDLFLHSVVAADEDGTVFSVERGTGDLVTLDDTNGNHTTIGATGINNRKPVAMEFAPDGTLYLLTQNNNALYKVDTSTGSATKQHDLDLNVQGGDLVFAGYNTEKTLVYVDANGAVHGIDASSYAETQLGTLSVDEVTSAAYSDGTYYAFTRDDNFASFTLDPFTEQNVTNQTGPFAWGDGTACPYEPELEEEDPTTTIDAPSGIVNSCSFTVSGEANADPDTGLNRVYVQLVNREDNKRYGGTTINLIGEGAHAEWSVNYDADADGLPNGDYAAHVAVVDRDGNKGTAGWTEDFTLNCEDEVALSCVPEENLLANADFEEPVVEHSDDWNIFTEGIAWLVDWVNPSDAPETASLELHAGVNGWDASEGNQYTELDGDWQGPGGPNGEAASVEISQEVPTVAGEEYTLSWDFSPRPDTVGTNNKLEVLIDGDVVKSNSDTTSGNTDWNSDSVEFTGTGEPTTIAFRDAGDSDSLGTFLDNTSLTCQPEPTAGPYCGDGEVNQEWEQCEVGDENCTNYCMADNQCHTERLAKIDLDDSQQSASFNGKIYLGTSTNPIPNGTWFNLDETGDALANQIADEVDGLAVERNQNGSTTLRLAYRGGNSSGEIDYVQGDIEFLGAETYPGGVDEYVMGANSYDLEDGTNGSYDDVFDASDLNQVDFDMRADTGDDGVTMKIRDGEEYGQCEIGEGDGNGENGDEDLYEVSGFVWNNLDGDDEKDDSENNRGSGITIVAMNQDTDEVSTTTTNSDGYYNFLLSEGTWIITQKTGSDWKVNYPDTEGNSYEVIIPKLTSNGFFSTIARIFTPVAHAAETHEDYITGRNFGNVFTGSEGSDNGTDRSASTQSTGRGGGPMLSLSSNSDGVDEVNGETDDPDGLTLGEQTTRVPEGAPDAGQGGAAGSTDWVTVLWALAALGAVYLWLRKEDVHVQSRN